MFFSASYNVILLLLDNDNHYQLCSCGEKINVASHDFDNGVITKEPTTTSSGEKTFTCKICGKTKIETIKPISKNYGTIENPISVSEALDVAKSDIKKDGEVTKKEIYCFGEVSSIGTKTSYGYQNVYVKDNSNDILIYTINVSSSYSIDVNDVIYFHGYIKMYDDVLEFATYNDGAKTYYVTLYDVKKEAKDLCFSINSTNFDYYASYDTNFDSVNIYSNDMCATFTTYNFDTESTSSSFIKLLAGKNYNNVPSLNGYIGNVTIFNNIKKVDVSYSCNSKASFIYGNDYVSTSKLEMPSSSSINKFSVDGNKYSFKYFKIQAGESDVHIKSIDIYFASLGSTLSTRSKITSSSKFDLSSYVINKPSEGQKVNVPYTFNSSGDVLSKKTFTYYSFSYVNAHKNSLDLDSIALTDPRDVATYYTIFNHIPVNFAANNAKANDPEEFLACGSLSEVKNIFGNNTRYVSKYDLTSGYMKSIPYNIYSGSKPLYYEFDIKLDSYSTSSRGEGRVVGIAKGLSCYNNFNNVCFYTDDHYVTFQEYLNNGKFSSRFDTGEKNVFATGKSYNSQVLF